VRTGGPWSFEEKRLHINCLEHLASSLAIRTFTKSRACAHVKLLMDNASAVAYINKMGGYSFPGLSETSDRSVGMVLSERYDGASSTSSRVLKCKGRPGDQSDTGFQ
jgi:hypothetical protein